MPIRLLPQLRKQFPSVEFIVTDPNENFPPEGEQDIIIFDTVKGIEKSTVLELADLEKTGKTPVSPHDYDLLMHLLLLKKLKKIKQVTIIGVPPLYDRTKVASIKKLIMKVIKPI